jgi:hypothetical protein
VRRATAIAKEEPSPPGLDRSDDDFQIEPFMTITANNSALSLFCAADSDKPRYWDYWAKYGWDRAIHEAKGNSRSKAPPRASSVVSLVADMIAARNRSPRKLSIV